MTGSAIGILTKLFRAEMVSRRRVTFLRLSRNPALSLRFGGHVLKVCAVIPAFLISICGGAFVSAAEADSSTVVMQKYAQLPLSFERHGDSEFVVRGQGYAIDIHGPRATIVLPVAGASHAVGMEFVHGRRVAAIPERELPGRVNYIIGKDPRLWRLGLPAYERVTYGNLYPSIDVVYYGNQKELEFDLVLKPGADVRAIRMRFSGTGEVHTDPSGSLMLGDLRLKVPTVIQGKKSIPARYKIRSNGEVGFEVGIYDRRQPLVIDPTLVYSTRLGGGNGSNGGQGHAIALDVSGNAYIAGSTYASDFPVANAAFVGYDANGDAFISKINSTGTALIYSTYIGGSNYEEFRGIAVDSTGAAWATGYTSSTDFPLLTPFQSTLGGPSNAVVVKLSPSGALAYSTFLGGPGPDLGYSLAVDPFGNAYVTGYASLGFPTTAGVYETVNQGSADAFVTKFSPGGGLLWSTFIGGTNYDYASGIAADSFGNTYITGSTYSLSFPSAPLGGAQPANRGNGDAFVAKLNFNGSALIYFTFLGGSGTESTQGIAVGPTSGIAVIAGQTTSVDLTTSLGAVQSTNAGGFDGFVAKLNAAGSAFLYTTYLGGNRNDFIQGLAVDPSGNAYLTGYTDSNSFPTNAAIQSAMQGNSTSLFRSLNIGASWTPFDANIPGTVSAILPDSANAGTIVVSTENGIYRTTNGGGVWTQTFPSSLNLSRSPANPATIYGVSGSAIYQSINGGVTWNFRGSLPQCCATDIVADPANAGTAYVFGFSPFGVLKTVNNGTSWSSANTGLPASQNVRQLVAGSDGSLYVGLDSAVGGVNSGGVYKSANQGVTWAAANNGLHSNFSVPPQGLAVAATNPSVVYVTDYFTLYESTNGGTNWVTVGSLPGGSNALAISRTDPATLYFGAYYSTNQMFVSTNSGVTWTPSSGLGVAAIYRIVADPLNATGAYALGYTTHEAIVAKIDTTGQHLLYSTYLGDGSYGFGIVTNGAGDAFVTGYVAGFPYNPEFPVTPGALQSNRNLTDSFVARISDATAACVYSVDPQQSLEVWYSHFVQYSITAPSGCPWTASSNQTWATIASGASGSGSGVVWVLADNTANTTQSATLTIAGLSVTLRQRTLSGCGYNTLSPEASVVPGGGGPVQFNVVVGAGCEWTITNNDPTAITVVSGASGAGNGIVTLNVAPNLGPNTRTFTLISPQGDQETISQAGTTAPAVVATITSSPSGASITVTGSGCIPGTYTTPASLTWNANANCTINFMTPQNIGGSPYTFYSATVNGSPSTTSNPLTVNSGSNSLTINANFLAPCAYSLSSAGQSFTAAGGLGSVTVTTAPTCTWNPVSSAAWITILPSGSKGTAKVNYAVAANNSGVGRSGNISVGGQQFNINQVGFACSYSIGPRAADFDYTGGTVTVVVTAPSGCPWTATSNLGWVTVVSGASGTGPGTVVLSAGPNTGGSLLGTLTIAGQIFYAAQTGLPFGGGVGGGGSGGGGDACGAVDVTSRLSVSPGGFQFTPPAGSNLYHQQITITNFSGSAISGPLNYVVLGLPTPSGAGLTGGFPVTTCFSSRGDSIVLVSGSGLAPGQHVTFGLDFTAPSGSPNYTYKVLSGQPSI
jgi:hypothetical protein